MGDVVYASNIAKYLDSELFGHDFIVDRVTAIGQLENGTLAFTKSKSFNLPQNIACVVLFPLDQESVGIGCSLIKVKNPRLAFAKVVEHFFLKKSKSGIHHTTTIGQNCNINPTVSIGSNCVIGDNVAIGRGTVINHNVIINEDTVIGCKCYIKSGTVIGEDGFGFDFEEDNTPVRIPHLGNVVIGDHVEIGAKNTIARATLGSTTIGSHTKTDDQVHIAHNCHVGEMTVITACAEISGGVKIGNKCWIGPNSSVIQKVVIGDNVTIGIGAIVTNNIDSGNKVMGLEALNLRALLKLKKRIEFGS